MKKKALKPTPWGRVHYLCVTVNHGRNWGDAIDAVGPSTLPSFHVRRVGDLYPPTLGSIAEEELVLLNLGQNGGGWNQALAWGKVKRLKLTIPRSVFAIGEYYPNLPAELGFDPMYDDNTMHVVATTECLFDDDREACAVWWRDRKRGADINRLQTFGGAYDWFVFCRPSATVKDRP